MKDLNEYPPEIQNIILRIQKENAEVLALAGSVFGIDVKIMHLVKMKLWDYFSNNYHGHYDLMTLIKMAFNPKTRGIARELRLIILDIAAKINDMHASGYSAEATEMMLRLMLCSSANTAS